MPPEVLYHGTGEKAIAANQQTGLEKRTRQHVHLSKDIESGINNRLMLHWCS
jgi:putative RNA 2'-phosphotransferase